jgi:SAM-dependent methyltransferase
MQPTNQAGQFQGVSQILVFNWPFYAGALVLDLAALILLARVPLSSFVAGAIMLGAALVTYFIVASLAISHYVYDRSPLYRWQWLASILPQPPEFFANIHAGLDQTSETLRQMFPGARLRILDIHCEAQMSEPSIERARLRAPAGQRSETADFAALPLSDAECDTIFVIFAAHELRSHEARLALFRELHRSLQPDGCVVLVEHLRDWRNFLAYGPGTFHFFSRREWLAVATQAGLRVRAHRSVTPFVGCFDLVKSS